MHKCFSIIIKQNKTNENNTTLKDGGRKGEREEGKIKQEILIQIFNIQYILQFIIHSFIYNKK